MAILTLKRSLAEETEKLINAQIKLEGVSSFIYLAMACWAETQGYENSANFLYHHAEEERMHMMKLIRYVNEAGGYALAPEITGLKYDYDSLRKLYDSVLEHEIEVSKSINNLVDHCFGLKDFATFQFLQWYVIEQREEEALARRIIELFEIIGEGGQGLWMIDTEIGKLAAAMGAGAAVDMSGGEE